jgi:hypothetical protein
MLLVAAARKSWAAVLAAMPAPLLARLDGWARESARKRAERRLRLLARR